MSYKGTSIGLMGLDGCRMQARCAKSQMRTVPDKLDKL